ncbi:translation initiation factor eIF-3b [Cristinia sonorae]|uniref:Eukaryotic translation initiation factor 3 subunit B n=1 Tax=Cristinia sonorae TaxID=1940300 RepID=A0A8K0XN46_9AGAR|nr:translation initiation factor eIF-3b [Cristinia sonorae]
MAPAPNGVGPHVNGFDEEDIDYSDIDAKYQVQYEEGLDNVVVVDGVPVIDKSKVEKLLAKIAKEFSKKGSHVKTDDMFIPWDEKTGKSKGFLFLDFKTAEDAAFAIAAMHGHPFDSKHRFYLNRFTDIERYSNLDETYHEPEPEPYTQKEHLRAWLGDPQGRDQYVTYRGDEVEIHWHGKPSQCETAFSKTNWTDLYVQWSPLGTYLASLHRPGVRLWGGNSWAHQQRFAHPLVRLLDFSPNENYLVTWSHDAIVVPEGAQQGPQFFSPEDEGNNIAVWDVKTGNLLRTFPSSYPEQEEQGAAGAGKKPQMPWPTMKWSPDDKYVARVTPGQQISVYELPSMGLVDKKSIKIEGVVDFEWCPLGDKDRDDEAKAAAGAKGRKPRQNILTYWTPESSDQNQPARVTVMEFPSRQILRQKNLFSVTECKLYWQNQGDFLCVQVDRHTKTKKSIFCNLEIFRVREKDFPVEVVELKDTVVNFSWEPKGERFAIVSSSDPNLGNPAPGITIKTDVSFYAHDRTKGNFRLLRTLPARTSNTIRWSPKGRHVVLATVGSTSKSELEFWDMDFNHDDYGKGPTGKEEWGSGIQYLGAADHYAVTDAEWDPSGRYMATSASAWRHTIENGYAIWDFKGTELQKNILDRFKQFLWRPRPRTLLTKEQQRQIRKSLKEYSRQFEEEDAAEESNVSAELIAQRKRLVDEWNAWRIRCRDEGPKRKGKENGKKEEEKEEIEVWIDEVIEQIEEEVVE